MVFGKADIHKHNLIESEDIEKCSTCGEPTKFIEYCYEVRCCSTECLAKLDKEYEDWIFNHKDRIKQ